MASGIFSVAMGEVGSNDLTQAWTEALATARPGTTYRVARIPISLARSQCEKRGCAEGDVLTCTGNGGGMLVLERADGRKLVLERAIAWYVEAEVCSVGGVQAQ